MLLKIWDSIFIKKSDWLFDDFQFNCVYFCIFYRFWSSRIWWREFGWEFFQTSYRFSSCFLPNINICFVRARFPWIKDFIQLDVKNIRWNKQLLTWRACCCCFFVEFSLDLDFLEKCGNINSEEFEVKIWTLYTKTISCFLQCCIDSNSYRAMFLQMTFTSYSMYYLWDVLVLFS